MEEILKLIETIDLDAILTDLETKKARIDKESAKLQEQIDQVNALKTIKNG